MITGLRLKITSEELRQHAIDRAIYHRQRAADKAAQLPILEETVEKMKAAPATSVAKFSKGTGYQSNPEDLVNDLKSDIQEHGNQALFFDYMAAHLFSEDYDLTEADLRRLQILK